MKSINLILLLLAVLYGKAQHTPSDSLGKISLSVVMPGQADRYTPQQLEKLQTKIIAITSKYGVSGSGYNSNFIISPSFEIFNEQVVEGMQNMTVLSVDLNLFIKQTNNNLVFSTYTVSLKGTGYSKNEAVNNAISQLNPYDDKVKAFIEDGKTKIIAFYNSKCNNIISEADKYTGMNDYERALAILMSVPVEATPCYDKIKDKSIKVFKLYQSKRCESLLQEAKAQSAGKQYMNALNTLAMIDPNSTCYGEAKTLINTTETKLDAYAKTQWDRQREIMKDKMEIEKMQIQAARDVTVAYFNRTPLMMGSILGFLF